MKRTITFEVADCQDSSLTCIAIKTARELERKRKRGGGCLQC